MNKDSNALGLYTKSVYQRLHERYQRLISLPVMNTKDILNWQT